MAFKRWVLPNPTPPQTYSGLYLETCSQTFLEYENAMSLLLPLIKFSKFNLGFNLL